MSFARRGSDGILEHVPALVDSQNKVINAGYDEIEGVQKVGMMLWNSLSLAWERASPDDVGGSGGAGGLVAQTKRVDEVGLVMYVGAADPGTLESETGWTVQRIQLNESGGVVSVKLASGIWDSRVSLTYL